MRQLSGRLDWTLPRTWFVTVRLLEVAAAVTVAGSAFQTWEVFRSTSQNFGPNGEVSPDGPPFLDRVTLFAMYGFGFGQVPLVALVFCLVLLLAVLAVLHFAEPVSHARVLRWEACAVWVAVLLLTLCFVVSSAVGLVRGDPNAPETTDDSTVTFDPGPSTTEVLLVGLAQPVVCLILLGLAAIWWLRLPEEFDEPEDEPVREPHRWRPAPAQDANVDDLTLDGVELIEPVERLQPRGGGDDGSTASGYDDYFRRF
jgi:hypothetical protein